MKSYTLKENTKRVLLLVFSVIMAIYSLRVTNVEASVDSVIRIQGENRFETAALISSESYETSDTVLIANAREFADALAGVPLAYQKEAPILLAQNKGLRDVVVEEITRLGAREAIILGGNIAISPEIEAQLKDMGLQTRRLAGDNRFETAEVIAEELLKTNSSDTAVLVDGYEFADAMSIAPFAAREGMPIYSTRKNSLSTEKIKDFDTTYIIGGENAVSRAVESQLRNTVRLAGSNRYETNAVVLNYFDIDSEQLLVATGLDFVDALTGSVLAANQSTGVALVRRGLSSELLNFLDNQNFNTYTLLGGEVAVPYSVYNELYQFTIDKKTYPREIKLSSLNGDNTVYIGEPLQLVASVKPSEAEENIYWYSPHRKDWYFNDSVISQEGVFESNRPGDIVVYAKSLYNDEVVGEITIKVKDTFTLLRYNGQDKSVHIPETIKISDVHNIDGRYFDYKDYSLSSPRSPFFEDALTDDIVGDITQTGNFTFRGKGITEVTLPKTLERIGTDAFDKNNLTSISLPDSVTYLGMGAFRRNRINYIEFSKNMQTINGYAFAENRIEKLEVPDNIESIQTHAFAHNVIEELALPKGLTTIGERAFYNNYIKKVSLPEELKKVENAAFLDNTIEELIINNGLSSIGSFAFSNNELKEVDLPDTISLLGLYAFSNNKIKELTVPGSLYSTGEYTFTRNQLSSVRIEEGVRIIGKGAFSSNPELNSVYIPLTVEEIDERAFYSTGLEEIVIPNSVHTIYHEAFSRSPKLLKISIGNNVELKDNVIDGTNNFRRVYEEQGAGTYRKNSDGTWSLIK